MDKLLEQFYKDNRTLLLKRLFHRAGSAENAEDVLQEAFLRALRYKSSFNPDTQELGAWFNTIMNNALRDFKRDERSMGTYVELEEEVSGTYEMSQTDGDMAERLVHEINTRKDRLHRDILLLYFVKEYKPREIRDVLGVNYRSLVKVVDRFKHEMKGKYDMRED